jgi:hypothetical protein
MFGIMLINGEEEKTSRKKMRRAAGGPLDANGCAEKNGYFRVRTDANGRVKTI